MEIYDRILVIRLSSLGDILLTSPTIRALRDRFPNAQIDFLVAEKFREAATLIPNIDQVITVDTSRGLSELLSFCRRYAKTYSLLLDLQNSFRSVFLRTLLLPTIWIKARRYRFKRWLLIKFKWNLYREIIPVPVRYAETVEEIGGVLDEDGLKLEFDHSSDLYVKQFLDLKEIAVKSYVVLCPGAKHFTKQWPKNYWIELGKILSKRNYSVFIVGNTDESRMTEEIGSKIERSIVIIDWTLQQIAALLKYSLCVVSNDSGLMHLASGVNVPHVAIFGPTVPEFGFYPYKSESIIFENKLPCRPCSAMGSSECPQKHFKCMNDTSWIDVAEAVNQIVAKKS